MVIDKKERYLFSVGADRTLKQWDILNDKMVRDWGVIHKDLINTVCLR